MTAWYVGRRTAAALVCAGLAAAATAPGTAQQPGPQSKEEWERLLSPPPPPAKPRFRSLVERGIAVEAPEASAPPSVDLYLNFAFDSAELDADARRILTSLGAALKGDKLRNAKLQIIGHTDAKGTQEYNQALSERRAEAVKRFLVASGSIDAGRIDAFGRGKSELKDPAQPLDGINRRVEIRNLSAHTQ